jgi:hypothetical protein
MVVYDFGYIEFVEIYDKYYNGSILLNFAKVSHLNPTINFM